jgi:hypothetical protein
VKALILLLTEWPTRLLIHQLLLMNFKLYSEFTVSCCLNACTSCIYVLKTSYISCMQLTVPGSRESGSRNSAVQCWCFFCMYVIGMSEECCRVEINRKLNSHVALFQTHLHIPPLQWPWQSSTVRSCVSLYYVSNMSSCIFDWWTYTYLYKFDLQLSSLAKRIRPVLQQGIQFLITFVLCGYFVTIRT